MVETVATLITFGRLEEFMNADTRVAESIRYYHTYMDRDMEEIRWRAARRWKTKVERARAGVYRPLPVSSLQLKGWIHRTSINRRLTSRQASRLVLEGHGRLDSQLEKVG
jgi:hypothetical protein